MSRRSPTRRDLLIVIGRLQNLIGEARMNYEDDRNQEGMRNGRIAAEKALDLCIEVRGHDPPITPNGPWAKETS